MAESVRSDDDTAMLDSNAPWPKITIVTPSFNQGAYLEQSIRSVILQRYPNLEYIVMDGGSNDGSADIIARYGAQLSYWVSQPDKGQADAIARGLNRSTGEILAWLNSDDILLPGALHAVARTFSLHPRSGVVYGNRIYIDEAGRETGRQWPPTYIPPESWAIGQQVCQECVFWRRSVYESVGGVDPTWFFIMDWHLFVRMSRVSSFTKTRQYLGCMRIHPQTKSSTHQDIRWSELKRAVAALGIDEISEISGKWCRFVTQQFSRFERLRSARLSDADFELWREMLQPRNARSSELLQT